MWYIIGRTPDRANGHLPTDIVAFVTVDSGPPSLVL